LYKLRLIKELTVIEPGEYGIKVVRVGMARGVQKEVYHPCRADICPAVRATADVSPSQGYPGAGADQFSRNRSR
jgi:hypothetical protein